MIGNIEGRDSGFYKEIIIVTVVAVVAAHAWNRLLNNVLNAYFPSLLVDFIVSIGLTLFAIYVANRYFSKTRTESYSEEFEEHSVPS